MNDDRLAAKFKVCPLLVQSDTKPSYTMPGESFTRTYFSRCLREMCAAYKQQGCFCEKFQCSVLLKDCD